MGEHLIKHLTIAVCDYIITIVRPFNNVVTTYSSSFFLRSYWYKNGCLYPDMGTVFIAIDKCDVENGCLKVLKILLHVLHIT